MRIAGGRCEVLDEAPAEQPDGAIRASARQLVTRASGRRRRGPAALFGRVRTTGDPAKAEAFKRLFL